MYIHIYLSWKFRFLLSDQVKQEKPVEEVKVTFRMYCKPAAQLKSNHQKLFMLLRLQIGILYDNLSHVVCSVVFSSHVIVKAMCYMIKLCLGQPTHKTLVIHVSCNGLLTIPQLTKCINDETCRKQWWQMTIIMCTSPCKLHDTEDYIGYTFSNRPGIYYEMEQHIYYMYVHTYLEWLLRA